MSARNIVGTALIFAFVLLVSGEDAFAQYARKPKRASRAAGGRVNPSAAGYNGSSNSNIFNRPTTSPYLNLLRPQGLSAAPNYQSLVQPQMQQERMNAQQGASLRNLQNQIGSLATRGQTEGGIRATGHTTDFLNNRSYFSGRSPRDTPAPSLGSPQTGGYGY